MVTLSGERLTSRLRAQLLKAMLQQSVGWHDEEEHTTGSLTTILSTDADNVKNVSQLLCKYRMITVLFCRELEYKWGP